MIQSIIQSVSTNQTSGQVNLTRKYEPRLPYVHAWVSAGTGSFTVTLNVKYTEDGPWVSIGQFSLDDSAHTSETRVLSTPSGDPVSPHAVQIVTTSHSGTLAINASLVE